MRSKIIISIIFTLLVAITIFWANKRAQDNTMALTVSIFSTKEFFENTEDVIIQVLIQNPSNQMIHLLKWHTPFEGIERSLFIVTMDGNPMPYIGKLVKRDPPVKQDYLEFKHGEQVKIDVILSDIYDLSIPGEYWVIYETTSFQLYNVEDTLEDTLRSEAIKIIIK